MIAYENPPPDKVCPFHNKYMSKVCSTCAMWVKIRGANPNTGQEVDGGNCAIAWQPLLLMENSQMQRQTGAAVESFRNEMVRQSGAIPSVMSRVIQLPKT
jgi:hypothetical protein